MDAGLQRSFKAGAAYFAIVFPCAFALGTVRVLLIAPRVGAAPAVFLEAPFLLTISWFASRWCVRRFNVPASVGARSLMGAAAFALLMVVETGFSVFAFGRSLGETFASYATLAGAVGLAAQAIFAVFPLAGADFDALWKSGQRSRG